MRRFLRRWSFMESSRLERESERRARARRSSSEIPASSAVGPGALVTGAHVGPHGVEVVLRVLPAAADVHCDVVEREVGPPGVAPRDVADPVAHLRVVVLQDGVAVLLEVAAIVVVVLVEVLRGAAGLLTGPPAAEGARQTAEHHADGSGRSAERSAGQRAADSARGLARLLADARVLVPG